MNSPGRAASRNAFPARAVRALSWGVLDQAAVRRAHYLNKSEVALAREQGLKPGRAPFLAPPQYFHAAIENVETGLGKADKVCRDARQRLGWRTRNPAAGVSRPIPSRQL